MTAWVCAAAVAAAVTLVVGPRRPARRLRTVLAGEAATGHSCPGPAARRRPARRRPSAATRKRCAAAVVEVVFALAAELRAGRTPAQALAAAAGCAGPLARPLAEAAAAVRAGAVAADELTALADLEGCERLRPVAAAWVVSDQAGGAVAPVLERLGEVFDDEDRTRRELDAVLAGPRATMTVLAVLPVLGVALGRCVGAHPLRLLLHRPAGWLLAVVAVGLDALGVAWTRRLVRAAVPP